MLEFTTGTCSIKRYKAIVWNKYWKDYETVETSIEIDIQPDLGQVLWIDMIKDSYKAFVETEDKDLIKIDDIIIDWNNIEYVVTNALYWKWNEYLPSNFELNLVLNKTK